jgi:hypothetical protein
VRQVVYLPELYEDARSEKYQIKNDVQEKGWESGNVDGIDLDQERGWCRGSFESVMSLRVT